MNYMKITKVDVANGPGCRVTIWVSGCAHACPGCHNPETWDPKAGEPFTPEVMREVTEALAPDYIRGLTVSGGDPLSLKNRDTVTLILTATRKEYPDKDIWLYTGYTWDRIKDWYITGLCDVIVDGPFRRQEQDITLRFRGSSNQRLIDVQRSLREGQVVLWQDDPQYASHEMV